MAGLHDADRRSAGAQGVQRSDGEMPHDRSFAAAIAHAAHVTDSVFVRQSADDGEDARPHVNVLMAIQMRDAKSRREYSLDLRAQLALDGNTILHVAYEFDIRTRKAHAGERALLDQRAMNVD